MRKYLHIKIWIFFFAHDPAKKSARVTQVKIMG